jgi:hypothetical protein
MVRCGASFEMTDGRERRGILNTQPGIGLGKGGEDRRNLVHVVAGPLDLHPVAREHPPFLA